MSGVSAFSCGNTVVLRQQHCVDTASLQAAAVWWGCCNMLLTLCSVLQALFTDAARPFIILLQQVPSSWPEKTTKGSILLCYKLIPPGDVSYRHEVAFALGIWHRNQWQSDNIWKLVHENGLDETSAFVSFVMILLRITKMIWKVAGTQVFSHYLIWPPFKTVWTPLASTVHV